MIPSLWVPVASFLAELPVSREQDDDYIGWEETLRSSAITSKTAPGSAGPLRRIKRRTEQLAKETHSGELTDYYHKLRKLWLESFAPALTVLHNFDPTRLSTLDIYSEKLGLLLGKELKVTEKTLADALAAEQIEITYDTDSHLCTLCLQIVRNWSDAKTIVGGLNELALSLNDTVAKLDIFISATWAVKDLT